MVVIDPRTNDRRLWWERLIWVVDMSAYLLIAIAGFAAALFPSDYVMETVQYWWIVLLWGSMLATGGVVAFIGRLSRVWAIEYFANVLAGWGAAMYAAILVPAVLTGSSWAVMALVLVATGAMIRRYSELKIFTNEPGVRSFSQRLEAARKRRTANTVPREQY